MMQNSEILLSICVPTYNRQFMLERNINFHLENFRRLGIPFEIVIVDDCSTDNTNDYLQSLAGTPELSHYRRIKNSGFVSNYAFAMRRARGRYAVFLGDDDLLIPEKVVEYVRIMETDPGIGMVQAPWMLVDARPGRGDMGPFYPVPGPTRFAKGDFKGLLGFILGHHAFPEFLIIRRDVLQKTISGATPFIFWAFLFTTRALDKTDILFMPEPFARVTAVSDDPRLQQGNNECMFQWDTYRGGLEYLASQMWKDKFPTTQERFDLTQQIIQFMHHRQTVALRLHIQAKNWVEAYVLYHRMSAYSSAKLQGASIDLIQKLAGASLAATEAAGFSNLPIIVDPLVTSDIVDLLPEKVKERLTRDVPAGDDGAARAWLRLDPRFGEPLKRQDAAFDISSYIEQFI
ncbi:glycosyltransferase family 2 protein [Rhizobium daejeonense]|uniref:Glycosyltransferase family 2 protein n=1 Tax=Rhizobium daejeonense TaxID=240521 RepID=A0A6M1S8I6_9HYPH|nr:glycosyltransferase family 2 protein [Rhizobium daejeonense]NGO66731.1 glycosyltransferase family 2 protein [Rhizobium daejeonense]